MSEKITPITRKEKIISGEDLEPITRLEWFLKQYRGGGSGVHVGENEPTDGSNIWIDTDEN